jgi:hypothetical protein
MDAKRFDAVTKAWVSVPRRRVLTGLATGALGTLLGHGGREASAQALSCRRGSDCPTGQACAHKVCVPTCTDPFRVNNSGFCVGGTGCPSGCFCAKTPGGGSVCLQTGARCDTANKCKKQRHCLTGNICGSGCCPSPKFVCNLPCLA